MQRWPRIAIFCAIVAFMLSACGQAAPLPAAAFAPTAAPTGVLSKAATPQPTASPAPTAEPVFAAGAVVAGVDVGGLTSAAAAAKLRAALAAVERPLELRAAQATLTISPAEIALALPVDEMLAAAQAQAAQDQPVHVPLSVTFDEQALRARLADLAGQAIVPPAISVITATEPLSRSFAYTPGRILDVDQAAAVVAERLRSPVAARTLTLDLAEDPAVPRVGLDQLQEQVAVMAAEWKGVAGFYLYDLKTGEEATFQPRTVFAGASTIKVAIMLNAYINLKSFTPTQEKWLKKMIVESDNLAANNLLAAAAGGQGTEYAFIGAEQMSAMLQQLGLEHTYLYVPYETSDYIKVYKPKFRCGPAGPVGAKPYTETGACLRATPYAIGQIYRYIDACASGSGPLLEQFELLSPRRCQEMLDRLKDNGDKTRMVAGIPKGVRIEHKSGWIENMQADAGVVRSPNGDYVLAVYIYRKLPKGQSFWPDKTMAPVVAAFSRLAYSAYNPVKLDK